MFEDLNSEDVFAAAARIRDFVVRTPLRRSGPLSGLAAGDVYLKLENAQITGSFKLRGAFNSIAQLSEDERARGVVTSSAGNHGLGVAYAAHHFGVKATVYVPCTAPQVKKDGILELGATIIDTQPDYDHAMIAAKEFAKSVRALYINPCLGAPLLAGQGTVALEILQDLPEVASMIVCVGGAGLLGGVGSLLRHVAPDVRIVGSQSVNTAAMARSLAAGRVVEIPSLPTLADGLAGQIDDDALDIGKHTIDYMVTLTEDEIGETIAWLAKHEGIRVEGAGAVAAGAILLGKLRGIPSPIVAIVSGGNIDPSVHAELIAKYGTTT